MKLRNRLQQLAGVSALPLVFSLGVTVPALAQVKPSVLAQAERIVPEDTNKTVNAKVWLNMRNRKVLDETVARLYQPSSPTYHQWLKPSALARFFPTSADVETVKKELTAQGLSVTSVEPHNAYVEVTGKVGAMQNAFHTGIQSLSVHGKAMSATTSRPKLAGEAGSLVAAISGLSDVKASQYLSKPINPDTGKAFPSIPVASPAGIFFEGSCFASIQTVTFKTPGAVLPVATYVGNRYGSDIKNTKIGELPPCGYDAAEVTSAYNMGGAYKQGLTGKGQTIVIVDAGAQPTIKADANVFSQLNNLPPLTSSNFRIIYPLGQPTTVEGVEETSLDVEWAHALAPGANIDLVLAPSLSFTDLESSVFYAIINHLGSVISNSYGAPELFVDDDNLIIEDFLSELGAAFGISVNYSSGDDGDFEVATGYKTVSTPADSPYSTSVGGTSIAINAQKKTKFQTGWGTNITKLASASGAPLDPPLHEGFFGGAGGGESGFFLKPSWQESLPGVGRQQPDVSLLADPYTGAEIIVTLDGQQSIEVIGGTSLSCPAFSGIWAIANQRAGQIYGEGTLLGQAAPIVASLSGTPAVTDVLPYTTPTDVAGFIFDSSGPKFYSASQLASPLENTTKFFSALYNSPFSGSWFDLTFGTDSSLVVAPGWDNVTGYGTPNGLEFIQAAAK